MITDTREQDTVDFAKVVINQKRLIIGIVFLAVVIGVAFSLLSKKIYMVDTMIEVGTYTGEKDALIPIENPQQLTEKILSGSYDAPVKSKISITNNKPLNIKADNPDKTNLVHVYISSTNPEIGKKVLEETNTLILIDHDKRFQLRASLPVGSTSTSVIKEPTISYKPTNQNPMFVMLFAIFVGLIFALLFAFSREYWRRSVLSE